MARRSALDDRSFASPEKTRRARELRRAMTPAERKLWSALRGKALGLRARPQHVIRGWIVDFYAFAAHLVIEVDGDVHDMQVEEDERRTQALRDEGLIVLRFRNDDVLSDLPRVLARIVDAIHAPRVSPHTNDERSRQARVSPSEESKTSPLSPPPLVGAGPGVGA